MHRRLLYQKPPVRQTAEIMCDNLPCIEQIKTNSKTALHICLHKACGIQRKLCVQFCFVAEGGKWWVLMHKRGIGSISCAHFSNCEYSETASSPEII